MATKRRSARMTALELSPEEFRALGHRLVDDVADFLASLPERPVTPGESPVQVRAALGDDPLPEHGADPAALLEEAVRLLCDHSLLNGHPRFFGYITSSPAPIGALGDLLAAAVNPNCGAWGLSPMATEIEAQSVRWISELIGYPVEAGGLLVSGGNVANLVGVAAARQAGAPWDVRVRGAADPRGQHLCVYATSETHTWLHKATDLLGLGTDCIRWIPPDRRGRADPAALRRLIDADRTAGDVPLVVVGTAGTVSTGAIDPLDELAEICRQEAVWFHVDAAYGGFAAALPDAPPALRALGRADSVAVDPHKWLYVPLEAGCALVRDPAALRGAFSYSPPYYRFTSNSGPHGPPLNYYAFGPQNSRGHRALKVWLALRQGGRAGYVRAIAEDILLARALHDLAIADPELEAWTNSLSITTMRYVPTDVDPRAPGAPAYLDRLNEALLDRLQAGGEAYLSNAVVGGTFLLRACVVNFRTTLADIEALATLVVRLGRELDAELRPEAV